MRAWWGSLSTTFKWAVAVGAVAVSVFGYDAASYAWEPFITGWTRDPCRDLSPSVLVFLISLGCGLAALVVGIVLLGVEPKTMEGPAQVETRGASWNAEAAAWELPPEADLSPGNDLAAPRWNAETGTWTSSSSTTRNDWRVATDDMAGPWSRRALLCLLQACSSSLQLEDMTSLDLVPVIVPAGSYSSAHDRRRLKYTERPSRRSASSTGELP